MGNDDIVGTQDKGAGAMVDIAYELVIDTDEGTAHLTCGGEVMWSSDEDPDFAEDFGDEFIDINDADQCDEIVDWLCDHEYVPPGVEVEYVNLADSMDSLDGGR